MVIIVAMENGGKKMDECITKHRAKHFVCEFCNEHISDEPCEPSDCEWMNSIDKEPAIGPESLAEYLRRLGYEVKKCQH